MPGASVKSFFLSGTWIASTAGALSTTIQCVPAETAYLVSCVVAAPTYVSSCVVAEGAYSPSCVVRDSFGLYST